MEVAMVQVCAYNEELDAGDLCSPNLILFTLGQHVTTPPPRRLPIRLGLTSSRRRGKDRLAQRSMKYIAIHTFVSVRRFQARGASD